VYAAQVVQTLDPLAAEYCPAAQDMQVLRPAAVPYDPAEHAVHVDAPLMPERNATGQEVHDETLVALENFPAEHTGHDVSDDRVHADEK